MGNRITGLIRYFVGLVSPSYVPETPLPRDPGKSASLPLAEALSTVEPGATATSGAPTRGTHPDDDARRSTRLLDGNSDDKLFEEGAHPSLHREPTSSTTNGARFTSGFWSTGPHPGYVLEGGARLPAQPSVDARTCWYKLPSSTIGEPLADDARVEIEHRNSLLDESFLSDDAEKPGGDMCCSKAV